MGKAADTLDALGIDALCESIGEGNALNAIAQEAGVSIGSLLVWVEADPERSARVREARSVMARHWDEKAEAMLTGAPDEFELKRAKELSHHYRWRASKIAPKEYGERQVLAGDPEAPLRGLTDDELETKLAAKLKALGIDHG